MFIITATGVETKEVVGGGNFKNDLNVNVMSFERHETMEEPADVKRIDCDQMKKRDNIGTVVGSSFKRNSNLSSRSSSGHLIPLNLRAMTRKLIIQCLGLDNATKNYDQRLSLSQICSSPETLQGISRHWYGSPGAIRMA